MPGRWSPHLTYEKDPLDAKPIETPSWRPIIGVDTIASVSATGTNLTVDSTTFTDFVVTPVISGGSEGSEGTVSITITTALGHTHNRSFRVKVRDL